MNEDNPIVFVVDDDKSIRNSLRNLIRSAGLNVQTFASAQEFLTSQRPEAPSCLVLDVKLPGLSGLDLQHELAKVDVQIPIIFITGHGDIPMTVRAMKAGAVEFLTKPFRDEDLLNAVEQAINRSRQIEQLKKKPAQEKRYCEEELRREVSFSEIVGQSEALRGLLKQVKTVAPTDSTVLIYGETGTGKELIARAIHNLSPRKDRPLVRVNCGAISAGLVESELFGHEKGAFTGAVQQRIGRFELADGGTIFLDEVAELPLDTQVKLLCVLQEGEFERVGSSKAIKVNVRIIAATNRKLKEAVKDSSFRSDLFYRLSVLSLEVPSLRERKSDIPTLANFFLTKFAKKFGKRIEGISNKSMDMLIAYGWPGNIRELQNMIERAVVLSQGPIIQIEESVLGLDEESKSSNLKRLENMERSHILRVLEEANWIINGKQGAASILGLDPGTLRSRMKKLGIKRPVLSS